jgi:hypothetical protein
MVVSSGGVFLYSEVELQEEYEKQQAADQSNPYKPPTQN